MEEVKERDIRITEAWKEDANALVVFVSLNLLIPPSVLTTIWKTGLFSAVVAAFIIESYKKLSPDTGNQTVVLLGQISQQLAGSTLPTQSATQPSSSSAIICVNAMWLMSLVLSITSALFATLLQQWARKYIQMPQVPRELKKQAQVRSFLFFGTQKYKMHLVVEIAPTLLHISVFFFFVGLVIFFFSIHNTVAIIVSFAVGLFGLAYLMLTILPCVQYNCPYRTPMTVLCWYPLHMSIFFAAHFLSWAVERLHDSLVPPHTGNNPSRRQQTLTKWSEICKAAVKNHRRCLKVGLEKSTIERAECARGNQDGKSLAWLCHHLVARVDKGKLQEFVASIPRNKIGQLMTPPIEFGKMALREPLLALVRSCAGTSVVGPDEYARRRSLFVSLEAVRHVAEVLIVPNAVPPPEVILDDVRIAFANIGLMRAMLADDDAVIRLTFRSICALLAKFLMRRRWLGQPELAWLQDATEVPSNTIYDTLGNIVELDHMNLRSFVCGVLSPQVGHGDLPTEHAAAFTKTLAILMDAGAQAPFNRTVFRTGLENLIQRIEGDPERGSVAANALRQLYQNIL
jgi:hypothetical protein